MHFSRLFKSSPHCCASPNGILVATLSSSAVTLRSTVTLETVNVVKLSQDLSGPVSTLAWSPSSSKLLVAAGDQIQVFSAGDSSYHATIRNPAPGSGKPAVIQFGARDTEIFVCSALGLKFVIFDLSTSKTIEVNSPKFHLPSSAGRGVSLRFPTNHLALLTRVSGKDLISIHHPITRQVQRSWYPDTIDAQGLTWTPDGRWLLLWESPAQGHKLLLYTPDGQFFRSVGATSISGGPDADLEPGIKLCRLSPDAASCVIGDCSRAVGVLGTQTWRDGLRLLHPGTIVPTDTLQVWQEKLSNLGGRSTHTFVRATQIVSPPSRLVDGKASAEIKPGCSSAAFDASSTLLVTRLDDSPCTLWIWDVTAGELRAVLIFHSSVNFSWHPCARELLLVTCLDEDSRGLSYVWDPLSNGPTPVSLREHLPDGMIVGKARATWVSKESEFPVLLLSDAQHYVVVSCVEGDQCPTPWREVAQAEHDDFSSIRDMEDDRGMSILSAEDTSALDDTFSFKHI
ncbi:hypothetical protein G7046_g6403 [Stylonectria norvegica]|nr:hypothetical protein G7046_g6403 [Stylonectria norvegica]